MYINRCYFLYLQVVRPESPLSYRISQHPQSHVGSPELHTALGLTLVFLETFAWLAPKWTTNVLINWSGYQLRAQNLGSWRFGSVRIRYTQFVTGDQIGLRSADPPSSVWNQIIRTNRSPRIDLPRSTPVSVCHKEMSTSWVVRTTLNTVQE